MPSLLQRIKSSTPKAEKSVARGIAASIFSVQGIKRNWRRHLTTVLEVAKELSGCMSAAGDTKLQRVMKVGAAASVLNKSLWPESDDEFEDHALTHDLVRHDSEPFVALFFGTDLHKSFEITRFPCSNDCCVLYDAKSRSPARPTWHAGSRVTRPARSTPRRRPARRRSGTCPDSVRGQVSGNPTPSRATIPAMPGDLYYGDNLDVMRHKISDESVDLIYLDPPFNSDRNYNRIHKESQAQEQAFRDTWTWDDSAERAFAELTGHAPPTVRVPPALSDMMRALRDFMGTTHRDTMAYLAMMAIRLVEMRRILRPTGSLYLHCDPTASHYLKLILDSIFGMANFRSEVIWKRSSSHNACRFHGPVHDVILFYTKSDEYTWIPIASRLPQRTVDAWYNNVEEVTGRRFNRADLTGSGTRGGDSGKPWRGIDPTAKGRHWAIPRSVDVVNEIVGDLSTLEALDALDDAERIFWPDKDGGVPMFKRYIEEAAGVPALDVITSIRHLHNKSPERVGYATQKPKALLAHLIELSSNPGDVVFDPFCGCGTAVEAAEDSGRKWIGIDVAIRAIDVIKERLDEKFKARVWTEYGEPPDVDAAAHLAESNAYDFQWWAVRKIGGQPPKGQKKKGGDGGIDGEITLRDFDSEKRRRVIISVKGGHTLTPDFVKALKTTVDMEKADYGILLTMHEPSQGMRNVARDCGMVPWASPIDGKLGHRIRIVTVPELFAGTVKLPGRNETPRSHSAPPPAEAREGETLSLAFGPRTPAKAKQRNGR